MNNEFKKIKNRNETRYILETASVGATSSGSVATAPSNLGALRRRLEELKAKLSVPRAKPRNPVGMGSTQGRGTQKHQPNQRQTARDEKKMQGVAEGIARGPKEKKLFELLEAWGYFISLKTSKIANDAIDNNASQELKMMQRHYLGPVMNGMSFVDITKSDLWQNPKAIPHLLKYIYQGIPYIEERIKKFVKPVVQPTYLSGIEKIKQLYREVVAQYSQGVAEGQNSSKFLYAFGEPGEGEYLVTFAQGKTNSGTYVDDMNKATLLAKKKNQESIQQDSSHNRRHHFAAMNTAKGPVVLQGQISSFPSKRFPSVEAAQKFVDEFNDSLGKDYMLSIHKVQQGMAEGSPVDLRKKISKYEELALAANRVGDDEKCKLYQKKIQALKQKMSQGVTEGLNTTEQKLLDMGRNQKYIYINGKQQHEAAKKLVAKGLAEKYDDVSYYASGGEYYINPFTRKQGLTKGGVRVYGGTLYFKDNGKAEEQLDELKCWDGYKRVPGTKAGTPGSCKEIEEGELNELSTDRLAKYKTASAADARAADKAGDFARGNKRFAGIVKATKKQFDNETKPKKESAIMKGLVDENLGTPYPGTYEQECGPFKRNGQERTMKIAFEGKKNVSRRT